MKNILIFNSLAFGDAICATHLAKVIKKEYPDCNVTFAIKSNFSLTMSTNEPDQGIKEVLEILALQEAVDSTALLDQTTGILSFYSGQKVEKYDKIYHNGEWWSDLGMVASMQIPYYKDQGLEIKRENIDTETSFNLNSPKELPEHIRVATAGPLDFNNKFKNEYKRQQIMTGILETDSNIELIMLGADINRRTYLESLKILNNCHIYVGPEGSLTHFAAGLGVDTISMSSPFPGEYLSPKYYHSGYHECIMARPENHCGTFKCITPKPYDPYIAASFDGPKSEFSNWPQHCPYIEDGWSCIANVEVEDIITEFRKWYKQKNENIF